MNGTPEEPFSLPDPRDLPRPAKPSKTQARQQEFAHLLDRQRGLQSLAPVDDATAGRFERSELRWPKLPRQDKNWGDPRHTAQLAKAVLKWIARGWRDIPGADRLEFLHELAERQPGFALAVTVIALPAEGQREVEAILKKHLRTPHLDVERAADAFLEILSREPSPLSKENP